VAFGIPKVWYIGIIFFYNNPETKSKENPSTNKGYTISFFCISMKNRYIFLKDIPLHP